MTRIREEEEDNLDMITDSSLVDTRQSLDEVLAVPTQDADR